MFQLKLNKLQMFLVVLLIAMIWLMQLNTGEQQIVEKKKQVKPGHYPDYSMVNFKITDLDKLGKTQRILKAAKLTHYLDDQTSVLDYPKLKFFNENDKVWNVSAKQGFFTKGSDVLLLKDDVLIKQLADSDVDSIVMETPFLKVNPQKSLIETDQLVTFSKQSSHLSSIGMKAIIKRPYKIDLLSEVRGVVFPQSKASK